MKKHGFIIIGLIFALSCLLSGCTVVDGLQEKLNSWMSDRLIQKSDISKDEDYITAEANREAGKLNENGEYLVSEESVEDSSSGIIHFTFAQNRNIEVTYYFDEERENQINPAGCYLNPGDSFFVSDVISKSDSSDQYSFLGFRFIEYAADGTRIGETDRIHEENGKIIIPSDYLGTEVGVEPIGKYEPRLVSLKAFWENSKKEEITIQDGIWKINGEEYKENETTIDPNISYTVTYEYDPDRYYFVEASEALFPLNQNDGVTQFKEVVATNGIGTFRVELHPYSTITIPSDKGITDISVSGRETVNTNSKSIILDKLKAGDTVTINTDKDYKLVCDRKTLSPSKISKSSNSYIIKISDDDNGEYEIKAAKWGTKTIDIDLEENGFWDKLKNNYFSWIPIGEKEEDKRVLVLSCGGKEYSLSDLQNGKSVKLSENDSIVVRIDKDKLEGFSIQLQKDHDPAVVINKESETFTFEYPYAEISSLSIKLIEE